MKSKIETIRLKLDKGGVLHEYLIQVSGIEMLDFHLGTYDQKLVAIRMNKGAIITVGQQNYPKEYAILRKMYEEAEVGSAL